ncbi:MAG: DUF302 domain-containing protein [Nitrososphaerota archaeon]|jgi:uncharacterized protein (DUF302 family)|nr:DUF302 domain-containing protein [Nitrososphaerota archaeon]MDG6930974.1 DUF302 domain-containing protein [Nitrososphaerota archaeon]MDG6932019.1 DUF302 domain-containing protein [Nitrososphaerota archaeon]
MEVEYRKTANKTFSEICSKVKSVVEKNGFAVVAEIDSSGIMRSKGFKYPDFRIYDVCNASYAHKLLTTSKQFETIIPCHIIVRDAGGKTEVAAGIPTPAVMALKPGPDIESAVNEVIKILKTIVDSITL